MTHLSVRLEGASRQIAAASPVKRTLSVATQSFAEQLSRTFADTPKKVNLALEAMSRHAIVTRLNSVTPRDAGVPAAAPTGFNALVAEVVRAAATLPASATAPPATSALRSEDDSYWSRQPAAVQQLRDIGDFGQRSEMAGQLTAEGYSIDIPVMVWGWDASKTTQLRQGFGYTWVPSAMQSPVTAAPGISGAAIVPYDPAHPPAGSITV
jgi:hypothetical protein